MVTLAVFRSCEHAPSGYINDRVYKVLPRALNFHWWHEAPEDAKVGDDVQGPIIVPILPPKQTVVDPHTGDLNVDPESLDAAEMEFMGGTNAPAGYKMGDRMILPLRYARFDWWKRVE